MDILFIETGFLTSLIRLGSQSLFVSASPVLKLQMHAAIFTLFMHNFWAWGLGPYACKASTLLAELFARPFLLLNIICGHLYSSSTVEDILNVNVPGSWEQESRHDNRDFCKWAIVSSTHFSVYLWTPTRQAYVHQNFSEIFQTLQDCAHMQTSTHRHIHTHH